MSANQEDYELFLNIFKVHSRYVLHKREALELISKKKRYSDAHIRDIAKIVKIGEDKIKRRRFLVNSYLKVN
ncbi:MAG: hypothetical protein IPO21_19240 [Bacteroidales bacterium]|nr:hypothetical protein [Bacteroidales bacterium]